MRGIQRISTFGKSDKFRPSAVLNPRPRLLHLFLGVLLGIAWPPGIAAADYVVRPGDNLTRVAARFGTTVEALVAVNSILNPDLIWVDQRLLIPGMDAPEPEGLLPARARAGWRKGLAVAQEAHREEDIIFLGGAWWYRWGWCEEPGCIPMVYWMQMPPDCPAVLLVGNEPNALPPFGGPIDPALAAARTLGIEAICPRARLVAGNVSADDWSAIGGWGRGADWLRDFLDAYRAAAGRDFAGTLGVHCYSQALAGYCIEQLAEMRALYAGPMWVTEFGILSGSATEFERLLGYIEQNFERFAAYTTRQPHAGYGWELPVGVELVNPDGSLTPAGAVYARR